jgi:hypothetical protein
MNVVSLFVILVGLLLPPFILVTERLGYETHSPLMDEKTHTLDESGFFVCPTGRNVCFPVLPLHLCKPEHIMKLVVHQWLQKSLPG